MNKKTLLLVMAAILVIVIVVIALTANGKKAPEVQDVPSAAPVEAPAPTPEAPKPAEIKESPKPTAPRPTPDIKVEKDEENGSGIEKISDEEMQSSDPVTGDPVSTDPSSTEPSGAPTQDDPSPMSYAAYSAMSAEEQYAFMLSFENPEAFLNWFNAAKAAYDASNPVHVLQPGDVIDLG